MSNPSRHPPAAPPPIATGAASTPPSWRLAAAVLVATVALAWSGALANGFAWDDEWLILSNPNLSLAGIPHLLTAPTAIAGDAQGIAYYRPLLSLSLALDAALWGRTAWGFHLTSLALHFACGLLLFAVARRLVGDRPGAGWGALAGAALFLLLPAGVEPVVYVAGRNDSLVAIFCLAALWFWLGSGPSAALWAAACTAAGLFTKETAIVAPVALVLADVALRRSMPAAERAGRWGGQALAVAGFLLARSAVLGNRPTRLPTSLGAWEYVLTAPAAVLSYVGRLLWPGLHTVHQFSLTPVRSPADLRFIAGVATLGALAALAFRLWREHPRSAPALLYAAGFGIAFPLAFPLLSAFESAFPVCERFLYVGAAGVAAALAFPFARLIEARSEPGGWPRAARVAVPLALLAVGWGICAQIRTADWRAPLRLFETLKAGSPDSSKIRYQLALALQREGRAPEALGEYEAAVRLSPANLPARNNLALLYEQSGRPAEAESQYREALALDPTQPLVRFNFGTLLQRQDRLDEAAEQYRQALTRNPLLVDAHLQLAEIQARAGDGAGALQSLREALRVAPGRGAAHARYGAALAARGQLEEGIREMRRGLELEPSDERVRSDLAAALTDAGRAQEAVALLQESLARWPADGRALYHAGNALRALNRRDEAVEAYRRSLALSPEYGRAANNLGVTLTELGRTEEALAAFDQLVAAEPRSARAHNNRGVALRKLGREAEARAEFETALRLDPTYQEPARHLSESPSRS